MAVSDLKDAETIGPPCRSACPIETQAREYIQCIAERRFEAAAQIIKRQNPLPRVCGRICTHPCEAACKRAKIDEPIAIAALKRFATEGAWARGVKDPRPEGRTEHRVAVVGSGPAGLSAAHDLALLGHQVTIFEALPVLGGMLRVGVPAYRLSKEVLDQEIHETLELGVEVKAGVRVGRDLKLRDLFDQGYQAVFLAPGAHADRRLGIPGEEDVAGVVSAVAFLRAVNQGECPQVGRRAVVIGGGNTAIDSARSLLRLGCEGVQVVYRRSREEMPASVEEIEAAVAEGVQFEVLTSPVEIVEKQGRMHALRCIKNTLGEPDGGGRRQPEPIPGSDFELRADMVVVAVGQIPELTGLDDEADLMDQRGRICVQGSNSVVTTHAGLFAGGDAVSGPATAIQAIAAGKRAAVAIDRYLQTGEVEASAGSNAPQEVELPPSVIQGTRRFARSSKPHLPPEKRIGGFEEVESVLSEGAAISEALRCLHCNLGARVDNESCIACLTCVRVCPLGIPSFNAMGEISIDPISCQACGMCAMACPARAIRIEFNGRHRLAGEIEQAISGKHGEACSAPSVLGFVDLYGRFGRDDLLALCKSFPNVVPVAVFGLARLDVSDILKPFELGADAVFLAESPPETNPFPVASGGVHERVVRARQWLSAVGIDPARLEIQTMPAQGVIEADWMRAFIGRIQSAAI